MRDDGPTTRDAAFDMDEDDWRHLQEQAQVAGLKITRPAMSGTYDMGIYTAGDVPVPVVFLSAAAPPAHRDLKIAMFHTVVKHAIQKARAHLAAPVAADPGMCALACVEALVSRPWKLDVSDVPAMRARAAEVLRASTALLEHRPGHQALMAFQQAGSTYLVASESMLRKCDRELLASSLRLSISVLRVAFTEASNSTAWIQKLVRPDPHE